MSSQLTAMLQEALGDLPPTAVALLPSKLGLAGCWRLVHLCHEQAAVTALISSARKKELELEKANARNVTVDMGSAEKLQKQWRENLSAIRELIACAYGKVVLLRREDGSLRYYRITQSSHGFPEAVYKVSSAAPDRALYVLNRAAPVARLLVSASAGERLELPKIGGVEVVAVVILERYIGSELAGNHTNFRLLQLNHGDPSFEKSVTNLSLTLKRELEPLKARQPAPLKARQPAPQIKTPAPLEIERTPDPPEAKNASSFETQAPALEGNALIHEEISEKSEEIFVVSRGTEEAFLGAHFYTQTTKMQEDLLHRPEGHLIVGGVAGSGKTSVALGRTKMLCSKRGDDEDTQKGFEAGYYRPETAVGFVLNVQLSTYLKQTLERLWLMGMNVREYAELRKKELERRALTRRERKPVLLRSDDLALEPEGRMAWLRAADRAVASATAEHLLDALGTPVKGVSSQPQQTQLSNLWTLLVAELNNLRKDLCNPASGTNKFLLDQLVRRLDVILARVGQRFKAQKLDGVLPFIHRHFASALRLQDRYLEVVKNSSFANVIREALKGREPPFLGPALAAAARRASEEKISDADVDVLLALYHIATIRSPWTINHAWIPTWLSESEYFTQVFIDEYQDFSEVQLFLMAEQAHPTKRTVTAVGDRSQRLHGGMVPDLAESFRSASTEELQEFFLLENKRQCDSLAGLSQRFRELALGGDNRPLLQAGKKSEPANLLEVDGSLLPRAVYDAVMTSGSEKSLAVLCASEKTAGHLQAELQDDLAASFRESKLSHQGDLVKRYFVHFTTPLQAKGLEFDAVVVAHLEEFDLSDPTLANACYVALSRPREHLTLVVESGKLDPRFELLAQEGWLRRPAPQPSSQGPKISPDSSSEQPIPPPPTPSV